MGRAYLVCCGHLVPSAPSRAPVPKVSLGHVRLFLKEEGEKGNKMAFGQGNDRKCSPPRSGFG